MNRHFLQVFNEFGRRMGMADLDLDADGHCQLGFDGLQVHIQALDESGQILCYAMLGPLDQDAHPAMAWELLNANYLYRQTCGATLSRDKHSGQCMLSCLVDGERTDTNAFEATMTTLVNTGEYWMQRLQSAGQEADGAQAPLPAAFPAEGLLSRLA